MTKLTRLETMMVNGMRNNEYNDAIEYATWTFTAIDNSGMSGKTASGVISSLIKKGLVEATQGTNGEADMIGFTDQGVMLFDNADGEECSWNGKRLLKVPAHKKPAPKKAVKEDIVSSPEPTKNSVEPNSLVLAAQGEVILKAFTGMVIGVFKITKQTKKSIVITTAKGAMKFDPATLKQLEAKNPKFANKIELGL